MDLGIRAVVLGSTVARHAGGSNDCIRNSGESMDTIYVPVCFKCRVSEHEIATGRAHRICQLCATYVPRTLEIPQQFRRID